MCNGEIVGFLGANGAGKTTTLKCLLGLYHYQGNIEVKGMDIQKYRDKASCLISVC
jgi:ABC-type multidrug transport system ATPase subunit